MKLFLISLLLSLPALAVAGEPTNFHYTNDQALELANNDALASAWFERCAAGGEFAEIARSMAPDPRLDLTQRRQLAAGFDRAEFERIANAAVARVAAELPQRRLTLCVDFAHPADTFARDQMQGVMAVTAGAGRIVVKLHPDADWATLLPYVLAHELHHSYWAGQHFDPAAAFTLADYLVFEGRADNFAMHVFGNHPAPWIDALTDAQFESTFAAFRPLLGDTSPAVLMGSMFGNPQAGIPPWAGYTVGYRLVAAKIAGQAAPDWQALTALPAADFIPAAAADLE